MKRTTGTNAIRCLALLLAVGVAQQATSQATQTRYTKMAPIDQYLMADRAAEIALARSAAPESIARDAEVQVLTRHGFETAVKGTNGFVCVVQRSWTSSPDFWNPKVQVPICLNAAGARSYLLRDAEETEWGLAGRTPDQINRDIAHAISQKQVPPMEPGAMCYMMSKGGYAGDGIPHWPSHLMFFYTDVDLSSWGANLPGSPVIGVSDPVEHVTQFVVVVQRWSDGTEYHEDANVVHQH